MNQYKLKQSQKVTPFSSYVVRSYSSEPQANRVHAKQTNKQPELDKEHDQFYGLIKGWSMKEVEKQLLRQPKQISLKNVFPQGIIEEARKNIIEYDQMLKKNNYHKKQRKVVIGGKNLSPVKKPKITDNKSLQAFYRYQLVSLLTLLNKREDYLNFLRGKKLDLIGSPLKGNEIEERLIKQLETKGKDKGRQKFNYKTNQQLRSLNYKSRVLSHHTSTVSPKKQSKIQYDDDDQEDEIQQQREQRIDMQTWKRRNGVGYYQKVFIIKGGYAQLRKALVDRGWYQNEDVWSPHFDFKWTTKIGDINYLNLKNYQSVNHFNNNHHLTSKYGITRRLRTLILGHGVDVDKFYPRCFDLGDQVDFENFVENFKFGFAESVARRFLVDKKRYHTLELKVRITADILKRRLYSFNMKIGEINKGMFPVINPEEWEIITETVELSEEEKKQKLNQWRKKQSFNVNKSYDDEDYEESLYEIIDQKIKHYLEDLKKNDPQIDMNGFRNIWIAKPNFMSRGRGIRCFNNIYDITDYCLGGTGQFVIQKYIEHPLVIEGKKFDIRQWVLIQDYCPPKIWFYNDCYIRFCADDFSLQNIYNRHIHLTNNSVQKYHKKGNIEKSMWTMAEFAEFVGEQKWKQIQQKMKNIVVWSIKSCEGTVTGRRGSCELVGYDFMIDENLEPWLIEINMSPSMEYSTPVTKKLVRMVLNDTAKIIASNKKHRDTGSFTCIYKNNEDLDKYNIYKF